MDVLLYEHLFVSARARVSVCMCAGERERERGGGGGGGGGQAREREFPFNLATLSLSVVSFVWVQSVIYLREGLQLTFVQRMLKQCAWVLKQCVTPWC